MPLDNTQHFNGRKRGGRTLCIFLFFVTCVAIVGCSFSSGEADRRNAQESTSPVTAEGKNTHWYNGPVVRNVLGDFDKAKPLEVTDPKMRAALRARGEYLVTAVSACGMCHGADPGRSDSPLSGGRLMQDRFGLVRAANITSDKGTGIGNWGVADIMQALRAGIDAEGRPLSVDLHSTYRWMSDNDAKAIAEYLLTTRPVVSKIERRELGAFQRKKWGLISQHHEFEGYVPAPPSGASNAYGRYLTHDVAGCYGCHTPEGGIIEDAVPFSGAAQEKRSFLGSFRALFSMLSSEVTPEKEEVRSGTVSALLSDEGRKSYFGNNAPSDRLALAEPTKRLSSTGAQQKYNAAIQEGTFPVLGPDIRGSSEKGLLSWTKDQIAQYLVTGMTPAGEQRDSRVCPWTYFRKLTPADREAIAGFLKQQ